MSRTGGDNTISEEKKTGGLRSDRSTFRVRIRGRALSDSRYVECDRIGFDREKNISIGHCCRRSW